MRWLMLPCICLTDSYSCSSIHCCIWPRTPQEYFDQVSGCAAALCNRMHASVGLAGMGIPSMAVGTDTRLLMVRATGLPGLYVKEASVQRLEEGLENLLRFREQWKERLLALRAETWSGYVNAVANATHVLQHREMAGATRRTPENPRWQMS